MDTIMTQLKAAPMPNMEQFFTFTATLMSVALMFSPLPRLIKFWSEQQKDTRTRSAQPSIFPFCVMLVDNFVGLWFSYLIDDLLSIQLRTVGIFMTFVYLALLLYTSSSSKATLDSNIRSVVSAITVLVCTYLTVNIIARQPYHSDVLGILNTATAIAFSASPLVQLPTIVESQDTSSIDVRMSAALFLCALSWAVRGILLRNMWIFLPNGVNAGLASLQLAVILYFKVFKLKPSHAEEAKGKQEQPPKVAQLPPPPPTTTTTTTPQQQQPMSETSSQTRFIVPQKRRGSSFEALPTDVLSTGSPTLIGPEGKKPRAASEEGRPTSSSIGTSSSSSVSSSSFSSGGGEGSFVGQRRRGSSASHSSHHHHHHDPHFEAVHPRDEHGRFLSKEQG